MEGKLNSVGAAVESGLERSTISQGPCVFLITAKKDFPSDGIRTKLTAVLAEEYFSDYVGMYYCADAPSDAGPPEDKIAPGLQLAEELGLDGAEVGICIVLDGKKYVLQPPSKEFDADCVAQFFARFRSNELEAFTKSADRPKDDMQPFMPGLHIATAKSFSEVALMEGKDVFVQEFANWCPYCVMQVRTSHV